MGQKVDPRILRTSPRLNKEWGSVLYASKKSYRLLLMEDFEMRGIIMKKYKAAYVSDIFIERPSGKKVIVNINAKKPGVIIGRSGKDIDALKNQLSKITKVEVYININEIKKPDLNPQVVAQTISEQLEKRVSFRRAMKKSIQSAMKNGAKGIRISCAGRLGGAEIARTEWYREGRVPLHTFRADIGYAKDTASTTYGAIGIKVWIYHGEVDTKKRSVKIISGK